MAAGGANFNLMAPVGLRNSEGDSQRMKPKNRLRNLWRGLGEPIRADPKANERRRRQQKQQQQQAARRLNRCRPATRTTALETINSDIRRHVPAVE